MGYLHLPNYKTAPENMLYMQLKSKNQYYCIAGKHLQYQYIKQLNIVQKTTISCTEDYMHKELQTVDRQGKNIRNISLWKSTKCATEKSAALAQTSELGLTVHFI